MTNQLESGHQMAPEKADHGSCQAENQSATSSDPTTDQMAAEPTRVATRIESEGPKPHGETEASIGGGNANTAYGNIASCGNIPSFLDVLKHMRVAAFEQQRSDYDASIRQVVDKYNRQIHHLEELLYAKERELEKTKKEKEEQKGGIEYLCSQLSTSRLEYGKERDGMIADFERQKGGLQIISDRD